MSQSQGLLSSTRCLGSCRPRLQRMQSIFDEIDGSWRWTRYRWPPGRPIDLLSLPHIGDAGGSFRLTGIWPHGELMNGRLIGLVAVASVAAACGSSSSLPTPPPRPTLVHSTNAATLSVMQDYGGAFDSALPQVIAIRKQVRGCVNPSTTCRHAASESAAAGASLLQQLDSVDQLRESTTSGVLAPGVSPVVIESESAARAARRASASLSLRWTRANVSNLVSDLDRLVVELSTWKRRFG